MAWTRPQVRSLSRPPIFQFNTLYNEVAMGPVWAYGSGKKSPLFFHSPYFCHCGRSEESLFLFSD